MSYILQANRILTWYCSSGKNIIPAIIFVTFKICCAYGIHDEFKFDSRKLLTVTYKIMAISKFQTTFTI